MRGSWLKVFTVVHPYVLDQVLNNKQTPAAMADSLAEASLLGVQESELAQGIQKRLDACRAWEKRGNEFFNAPGRAPLSALEVHS